MKVSSYNEILGQLKGEKNRVNELSAKISDMFNLNEQLRENARDLSEQRDK